MQQQDRTPEFARPVAIDDVGRDGLEVRFEASADECARLARRLGLDGLSALQAVARLQPVSGNQIRVNIDFSAEVLQTCVISLEPVASRIQDQFDELFSSDVGPEEGEVIVEAEGEGPPEAIVDGMIDVGELVVQYLSLAIDPYPRRPEAGGEALPADMAQFLAPSEEAAGEPDDVVGEDARDNPFAALSALRRAKGHGGGG